ncbi:Terminase small subunit [compost metagenome]
MVDRAEKSEVNAQWVLDRLVQLAERCMQAEPVTDRDGSPTGEYRFDSSGANKALENIGKHLGMFKDKLEVDMNVRKLEDFL